MLFFLAEIGAAAIGVYVLCMILGWGLIALMWVIGAVCGTDV